MPLTLFAIIFLLFCCLIAVQMMSDKPTKSKAPTLVLLALIIVALIFVGPNIFFFLLDLVHFYFS